MKIEEIKDPTFLNNYDVKKMETLSKDIRQFLIEKITKYGGHLSSNLGVVELTIAIHFVFDFSKDKLVFDIGHQSYVHKILTGRGKDFHTLRQLNGLSGFQSLKESEYDHSEAGHAGTSIGIGMGLAYSSNVNNIRNNVISIIGDASITNGVALESLNDLGHRNHKLIIVLNDNEMSISQNIGSLQQFLGQLKTKDTLRKNYEKYSKLDKAELIPALNILGKAIFNPVKKNFAPQNLFENLGLEYMGPVSGHNIGDLIYALNKAKETTRPIVLHVKTVKGKGLKDAELDKDGKFHGLAKKNVSLGNLLYKKSWSEIIAFIVYKKMKNNSKITVITPAMKSGSKLEKIFSDFPKRSIDSGIAESHAVLTAVGLSLGKARPFVSIYSTFLQRAFDQIIHDVAKMEQPLIFGVDRCGIIGEDGASHQGLFDLPFLLNIPNIVVITPNNQEKAEEAFNYAFAQKAKAVFIRYSKNKIFFNSDFSTSNKLEIGKWEKDAWDSKNNSCIISYGDFFDDIKEYLKKNDKKINLINALFQKPIDKKMMLEIAKMKYILVYEESYIEGGLASKMLNFFNELRLENMPKILVRGIKGDFIQHGVKNEVMLLNKLSPEQVFNEFKSFIDLDETR